MALQRSSEIIMISSSQSSGIKTPSCMYWLKFFVGSLLVGQSTTNSFHFPSAFGVQCNTNRDTCINGSSKYKSNNLYATKHPLRGGGGSSNSNNNKNNSGGSGGFPKVGQTRNDSSSNGSSKTQIGHKTVSPLSSSLLQAPSTVLESTTTDSASEQITSDITSQVVLEKESKEDEIMSSSSPFRETAPLVLVGLSGAGKELTRLANFLANHSNKNGEVISVVDEDGSTIISLDDVKDMLTMENNDVSQNDVIIVDLSNSGASCDKTIDIMNTLQYLQSTERCPIIYINVDPEASSMDAESMELKDSLEDKLISMSQYEIAILDEGSNTVQSSNSSSGWNGIEAELVRLVAHARLPKAEVGSELVERTMGKNTFFLSLSFDHVSKTEPYIEAMCKDVDAMELRVDLLKDNMNRHSVLHQLQQLRHMCRPHAIRAPAISSGTSVIDDALPIVYTVRTEHQAGTHPDDKDGIERMFELLKLGLRGGVEVLDVESAWDSQLTSKLLNEAKITYPSTMILGSHHVVGQEISLSEAVQLFENCALDGRAHGAKVVLSIDQGHEDRATMAYDAGIIASHKLKLEGKIPVPNVSLVLGEVGVQSRVVNENFTPVTHESLPMVAAPGQLSAKELMKRRIEQGMVKPQKYAILGHNIAYSVSPQMQGGAFDAVGLPHHYGRADVEDVEEFINGPLFTSNDFGGASVTIPHKQSIMPYVDILSDAAKEIGAVNTLVAKYDNDNGDEEQKHSLDAKKNDGRIIYGDNTDWLGIYNPIKRKLNALPSVRDEGKMCRGAALILGGGGTARAAAYAARELGLERIYYNRTPSKAQELAETFGGVVITSLDESGEGSLGESLISDSELVIQSVISTLPAAAKFELPKWLIEHSTHCPQVVLDVNYKPYHTLLLNQCEQASIETIRGSEMLWEQGVRQFELWTGRLAPYRVMKTTVLENCLPSGKRD